jgi:DNA-binding MurR/RpiR family transcriptional regulator
MVEITRYPAGASGEDLTAARQRIIKMHNKPCMYDGIEYPSLLKLATKLGVSKATVTRAIRKGEYKGIKMARI